MAVGNSVGDEIREERRKAMDRMTWKEKFAYFWDYYKIHALVTVCVVAAAISIIHQIATNKDYGFYAVFINALTFDSNSEIPGIWAEEFQEYAGIDPNEYDVAIDTTISLSTTEISETSMANQQKMVAMVQTGSISTITADTEIFEQYAQSEMFFSLEEILSEEELEKYRPYFYYTDAGTFPDDDYDYANAPDLSVLTIDHRDPSTMEEPIPVGIIVSEANKIADAQFYAQLPDSSFDYQGYHSEAVMGVPVTNPQPELMVRFLEYLGLGE